MASDPKLLVVTDIHGAPPPDTCLSLGSPIHARLSLAELCKQVDLRGEALHRHLFQEGGIAVAVEHLHALIAKASPLIGLGYSAGGTALWTAVARRRTPLLGLMCISSTRLREEGQIPIPNTVVFGASDPGAPPPKWLENVPKQTITIPNADHAFYADGTHTAVPDLRKTLAGKIRDWRT